MSSAQFALADAVAEWIGTLSLPNPFGSGTVTLEPEVSFYPKPRLKDLSENQVVCTVYARGSDQERAGGMIVDEELATCVLIEAKCVFSTEPAKVRALVDLVDAIKQAAWTVSRFADAPLSRIEHRPLFDLEAAETHLFKAYPVFVFPSDFEIGG